MVPSIAASLATFTLVTEPSKILPATGRRESNTPKNGVPAAGAVANVMVPLV